MLTEKISNKKPNPKNSANLLSRILFAYTFPTVWKAFKSDLTENDIPETPKQYLSEQLGDKVETLWEKEKLQKKPSLSRALFRTFGISYIFRTTVMSSIEVALRTFMSLALFHLMAFYEQEPEGWDSEPYIFIGIYIGIALLLPFFRHYYLHRTWLSGNQVKITCCSLIYRKLLKLKASAVGSMSAGQITNLLCNDVAGFEMLFFYGFSIYAGPLQIAVSSYILYRYLGILSLAGVVFMIILIPIQIFLGKKTSDYRVRSATRTDERIRLMNEIIRGIHVIKTYAWEKPFGNIIAAIRSLEVQEVRRASYVTGVISSCILIPKLAVFITILVYAATGNKITSAYAFFTTGVYNNLREIVTGFLPKAIACVGQSHVTISRLQTFLMQDEFQQTQEISNDHSEEQGKVKLQDVIISSDNALLNSKGHTINLEVQPQELLTIIGPVGSGKTTIIGIILNEIKLLNGTVKVSGDVSYASQEPWIFNGTLQENVLFGQKLDILRYREVLGACALDKDIENYPHGDQTQVGERGVMLSGGQRARINLARTIYVDADIYLLDNPLSAVDTLVGKHLFNECIVKFLHNKSRIVVTHQLEYLDKADKIVLVENGIISFSGTYTNMQKSGLDFARLLAIQKTQKNEAYDQKATNPNMIKSSSAVCDNKEDQDLGKVRSKVYVSYFKLGGSLFSAALCLLMFFMSQSFQSLGDYFVVYWIKKDQSIQSADNVYSDFYIYTFSGIVVVILFFAGLQILSSFKYLALVSINVHKKMFMNLMNAPLRFFNTNPTGRILNRFTNDLGLLDNYIPMSLFECLQLGFMTAGVLVIVSITNLLSIVSAVVIIAILYLLMSIWSPASYSLKRLISITQSPIICHVSETIEGLLTIRARKAQKLLLNEFHSYLNSNCTIEHLYLDCYRGFGLYADLLCVVYAGIVIIISKEVNDDGATLGFTITQAMLLTTVVQLCIRTGGELDSKMTSVERVLEYCNIEPEETEKKADPPRDWPRFGNILFSSVSMKYSASDPFVLKNIDLSIKHQEKIGIVGRTGAGKSSLITALLQLTPSEGRLTIDEIDVNTVPLSTLRSRIAVIPQQPTLFSGTLRRNLDPYGTYPDSDLWNALNAVQLKEVMFKLPSGLDYEVSGNDSDFSVGQRQLICLARAIINKRKILLLDEATANVDPYTDILVQNTIRSRFQDCTVLTIAHRLSSIMDSDKVVVMDEGCVVEFDTPQILLRNRTGRFYSMTQDAGGREGVTRSLHVSHLGL